MFQMMAKILQNWVYTRAQSFSFSWGQYLRLDEIDIIVLFADVVSLWCKIQFFSLIFFKILFWFALDFPIQNRNEVHTR